MQATGDRPHDRGSDEPDDRDRGHRCTHGVTVAQVRTDASAARARRSTTGATPLLPAQVVAGSRAWSAWTSSRAWTGFSGFPGFRLVRLLGLRRLLRLRPPSRAWRLLGLPLPACLLGSCLLAEPWPAWLSSRSSTSWGRSPGRRRGVSASGERVRTPPPTIEREAGADASTSAPDEMASPGPQVSPASTRSRRPVTAARRHASSGCRATRLELTGTSAVGTSSWRAGRSSRHDRGRHQGHDGDAEEEAGAALAADLGERDVTAHEGGTGRQEGGDADDDEGARDAADEAADDEQDGEGGEAPDRPRGRPVGSPPGSPTVREQVDPRRLARRWSTRTLGRVGSVKEASSMAANRCISDNTSSVWGIARPGVHLELVVTGTSGPRRRSGRRPQLPAARGHGPGRVGQPALGVAIGSGCRRPRDGAPASPCVGVMLVVTGLTPPALAQGTVPRRCPYARTVGRNVRLCPVNGKETAKFSRKSLRAVIAGCPHRVQVAGEPGPGLVGEVRVARIAARPERHDPAARVPVAEVPDVARHGAAVAVVGHAGRAGGGEHAPLVPTHRVARHGRRATGHVERADGVEPVALTPRGQRIGLCGNAFERHAYALADVDAVVRAESGHRVPAGTDLGHDVGPRGEEARVTARLVQHREARVLGEPVHERGAPGGEERRAPCCRRRCARPRRAARTARPRRPPRRLPTRRARA